ncbi:diguanylate cyclase [Candidatus Oleimmundimicrobium sp.]|uniref:diguanylate cyclase n=1 Tax=Candidatus Oleimmundimicrobium sp. TaxID=3060597 RepID=UPI00271842CB|nr:diguanylate cyclase [Candidatus Oleimmundimicrobium sp.]MDO8886244.1 diguanylate cyclase [Candidatus Oleimmundimicrobium sp.]
MEPIKIIESYPDKCKECYSCIRSCPVKSIKISNGCVEVLDETCIYCGECVIVCSQGALVYKDSIQRAYRIANKKKKAVAILSPECLAAFPSIGSTEIAAGLIKLGFDAIEGTILGEELVAAEYKKILSQAEDFPMIRSTCPVVTNLIEKYFPNLIPYLAPVVSPMIAQGRLCKELYEGAYTVYVTSCVAQKAEAMDEPIADAIDTVITFSELKKMFEDAEIDLKLLSEAKLEPVERVLRVDSLPGGLPRQFMAKMSTINRNLKTARGVQETHALAEALNEGEIRANFVDVLNCKGCIDGPVMRNGLANGRSLYLLKNQIQQSYRRERKKMGWVNPSEILPNLPKINLRRTFTDKTIPLVSPAKEELKKLLAEADIFTPEDELNCGACGYKTCVKNASAIYQGVTNWSTCFPYQKKLMVQIKENAEKISMVDAVTGLLNHYGFTRTLKKEAKRAHRYGSALSIIVLDIDRFKLINDTYGHVRGDEVLKSVAKILCSNLRETDFVARQGGDEFTVILPQIEKTEAFAVAEKLRCKTENFNFIFEKKRIPITLSLGVASLPQGEKDPLFLFDMADKAMYQAKKTGRNKTCIAKDI